MISASEALNRVQRMQAFFTPLDGLVELAQWVQSAEGAAQEAQGRLASAQMQVDKLMAQVADLQVKHDALKDDVDKLAAAKAALLAVMGQVK